MSLVLPKPIAAYFAAENSDDTEALLQCFAEHAVVRDEGQTIEGLAAIKQWHVEAKKKYHHTVQPIDAVERDGKTRLTTTVLYDSQEIRDGVLRSGMEQGVAEGYDVLADLLTTLRQAG